MTSGSIRSTSPRRSAPTEGVNLSRPRPLVVPILRAGLGMLEGMMRLMPTAEVGFLGMVRNEETLQASTYAERLPADLSGRQCYVLDPMLATGGTLAAAIQFLTDRGADHITCICLLVAPEGVENLETGLAGARRAGHRGHRGARRAASTRRATSCPAWATRVTGSTAWPSRRPSRAAGSWTGSAGRGTTGRPERRGFGIATRGSVTVTVVPLPCAEETPILPPCRATIAWTMVSPSPVPWTAPLRGGRGPEEPREQLRLVILGDAHPVVLHHDLADLAVGAQGHLDRHRRRG